MPSASFPLILLGPCTCLFSQAGKAHIKLMRTGSTEFSKGPMAALIDDLVEKEGQHTVWTVTFKAGVAYRSKCHKAAAPKHPNPAPP